MSISTCCKAPVKYDCRPNENEESGLETIVICQSCGKPSGEYNPPCFACGSDDPCSCFSGSDDTYYSTYDKNHGDETNKLSPDSEKSDDPLASLTPEQKRLLNEPIMLVPENIPDVKMMRIEILSLELELLMDRARDQVRIRIINDFHNRVKELPAYTYKQARLILAHLWIKDWEQKHKRSKDDQKPPSLEELASLDEEGMQGLLNMIVYFNKK